jgi:hypothetical protein
MSENIKQKIREQKGGAKKQKIRELGFSKESAIEYLNRHTRTERLQRKIQSLQLLGFSNPISLIEKHPPIADCDINRIIQSLQLLGFSNPISLIEKFPKIVSYDINRVVSSLRSIGFTNPTALIEKFPPVAGLKINRIKRKIDLIQRLNKKFQLQLNPIKTIENFPRYLSLSLKKIFFSLKIASFYNVDEKFYQTIVKENPLIIFDILYSLYKQNKISDKDEFRRLIIKIRIYPKELKKTIQNETKTNLPQIIENLKQKKDDENAKFLLKLAGYLEDLLKKEKERKLNL